MNPVESRIASLDKPESLDMQAEVPPDVARVKGFIGWNERGIEKLLRVYGLRHDLGGSGLLPANIFGIPSAGTLRVTELRVIDTYWSDHCRHTTFLTRLEQVEIEKGA